MLDLPPPDPRIEITIASRGISKGLAQTEGPQVLVRPELEFGPVYLGAYAKNVSSPTSDGEAGPAIGLRSSAGGFDLAASATLKFAVAPLGTVDDEALELVAAVSRRAGPVTPRLSVTWSPNDLGATGRSIFAEAGASVHVAENSDVSAAFGRRERGGGADYSAFNVGISRTLAGRFTIELRWYDTDRSALGEPFRGRLVAHLRSRF